MRTLRLAKETLADLTTEELGAVVGAGGVPTGITESRCTGNYQSILAALCG